MIIRDNYKTEVTGLDAWPTAHPLLQSAVFYTFTVVLLPEMILQIHFEFIDYYLASDFCSVCTIQELQMAAV